ncbi:MAG: UDP-N-acetylmuramyl pentapeptide phosphotransferase/UDP-N-acetylglucosamine-phosphate transferase [Acidimicrobiales bacterium]|nr:UDP-N-acetylmuramyl pentapeptide phosphotransferase/UDP-N-acetylglucosamine-phosphate transferase [Acidimicrobiales bacterium]
MYLGYGIVFAVAALATFATTPIVRRVAIRFGAVVHPDERRVHDRPTPTLGGGAMFIGFLAAMGVAWALPGRHGFSAVFTGSTEPLGVVLAAGIICSVGLLDDIRDVSPPAKLAGQVLAGSVLSLAGVTMLFFRVPFADFVVLSPDLAPLITVLWVVGMANAINLIDGLDGLAAGIVAIAAGAFFLYSIQLSHAGLIEDYNIGPLIAAITCGICVGFLPHNFTPAKIFMGDAGAMLLGVLMASSTLVVGGRTADQFSGQTYFFFAPLIIPFFILGVPILDTAFAIIRRALRRSALSEADKEHLHHRLMRLGHGQRRSVLILWAWTAVLSAIVLYPTYTNKGNAVVPGLVAGLGIALYTYLRPGARRAAKLAAVEDPPPEGVVVLPHRRPPATGA